MHIVDAVRDIADMGYKHVELCCSTPGFDYRTVTGDTVDRLKALAAEHGLIYTLHPHVVNTADTYEPGKALVQAHYVGAARLAARVGAKSIVVHVGYRSGTDVERARALERSLEVIAKTGEVAYAEGIGLMLENTDWGELRLLDSPADLLAMREQCPKGTRLLLDTGHAVLQGFNPAECAELWMPHLAEIHAHDNHGGNDEHLAVGDGIIDWEALVAELATHSWTGVMMIEIIPEAGGAEGIKRSDERIKNALARSARPCYNQHCQ
jgi:sugar phosphate isomerase/epimerase